jgi:hypothetical protein
MSSIGYLAVANDSYSKTVSEQVTDWLDKSSGLGTCYRTIEKTLRLASEILQKMGNQFANSFAKIASKFTVMNSGLGLYRVVKTTKEAFNTIFSPKTKLTSRDHVEAISNVADAGETIGWSGLFLFSNPIFMSMAGAFGLVGEVTDAYMSGYDVKKAASLLPQAEDTAVQKMLKDTKTHALMKLVRAVSSLALTVLGATLLATGCKAVPTIAVLAIGVGLGILSIATAFFKEMAPYKLAKFSEPPVIAG